MTSRKEYKSYLQKGTDTRGEVNIPPSTWRRWLLSGRITKERLQELGIKTNQRKRKKKEEQPQIPDGPWLYNVTEASAERVAHEPSTSADVTTPDIHDEHNDDSRPPSQNSVASSDLSTNNSSLCNSSASFSSGNSDGESEGKSDSETCVLESLKIAALLKSKFIGPAVLNERLHPNLAIRKYEVLMMILHLSMRHRMTDLFIEHLILFVENIIGVEHALGMSKHLFFKLFQFGKEAGVHFYCPTCCQYLGQDSVFAHIDVKCLNDGCEWSSTASSLNDGHYFLTLDIRSQLQDLLNRPGSSLMPRDRVHNLVSDIMDGSEYKSHTINGRILSADENALTLTVATDGSPVFKSGPNSLWPVHAYVNEKHPTERFKSDNMILAGIWFGKSEANVKIFMQPIVAQLQDLENNGVVWQKPDGSFILSPVYVVSCVTDTVARPKVQQHTQFNGYFGCGICLHPNNSVTVIEKVKIKRREKEKGKERETEVEEFIPKKMLRYLRGDYELRSNVQLREHMRLADSGECGSIMGSTGKSVFFDLKYFNVVYGFPIDYMHAVLLGTVKRTVGLWFDSTSHTYPYYIGLSVGRVDDRLSTITLPSGFRTPRKMSDRVHWKANEWRSFLLYFSLPVLVNILPPRYYEHFKSLVVAIYTLTKENILLDEIANCNRILQEFVWEYQDLYGEKNMVCNIHLTGHLAQVVSMMGPLWAFSAFPFESANGRLVKLAMGTKGVATQICRKYLMTKRVTKLLQHGYHANDSILDYCCNIIGFKYLKHAQKGLNDETLLGRPFYYSLNDVQKQAFSGKVVPLPNSVLVVNRTVIEGKLYHGRLTTRQIRACDSCVRLTSGEFALIDLIVLLKSEGQEQPDTLFLITKLNVSFEFSPFLVEHIKQCNLDSYGDVCLVRSDEIVRKSIFYSCNDSNYVADISNFFETD